ncbi:c-type cytochrome [Methylibium sp.]|uniref:c-type cytochrome n=1 Tax=Methylibium sp. TaxID=2067992 RepID=UPI00286CC911|nr:c-type cytochrome [Methylibium sp.]
MKSALSLLFAALFAAVSVAPALATETKPKAPPDLKKGEAVSTAVCAACHSADGSRGSPANPILQGQHPEYLAKQLAEFKSGARDNAIMKGFASALSDDDMRNVAGFYAGKQAKPGFARNKELVALGERIYRGGIADKQVPACAGCHSPNGAGIPSHFPRLGGQHAEYTKAQLNAFRREVRTNSTPMLVIASRLSDREIDALADYVAGLR